MLKKCYRCGKLFLFFKVNEFGRCKECEQIAKEEQRKSEIKEQKANEQKKNNRYIKPAPNYNTPVPDNVNTQPPTNYSFHRNSVDAEIMLYYDIQRDTAHRGDIDSCAEGLLFVKLLDEID